MKLYCLSGLTLFAVVLFCYSILYYIVYFCIYLIIALNYYRLMVQRCHFKLFLFQFICPLSTYKSIDVSVVPSGYQDYTLEQMA